MSTTKSGLKAEDRKAIGITLGNSNSSIAHVKEDDNVEVIGNEDGDRQIPTVLSYVDGDEYYGQQAKSFLVRKPEQTVAYFRDFLGKDFKDIDPTHNHASVHPQEANGTVSFTLKDKAEEDAEPSTLSVSEVTTRYLRRLVGSASDYKGVKVNSAVITVPTNFSDKQKAALVEAAANADLEVLQMISEPVAAILAYNANPTVANVDKNVVVADLGGTRSDVAVVAQRGGLYTVLATEHDYDHAGAALDKVLIDHFAKEFMKKHPGAGDPRENARSLAKLKQECEQVKKSLSIGNNASFGIESLAQGIDFQSTINRLRYETTARSVFGGFTRLVESVIKKAGLDPLDIDEVILCGGTSHTPRIAHNLKAVFPEATTIRAPATSSNPINPSELAVRGAALQASLIEGREVEEIEQATHPAVTTVPHLNNAIGVVSLGANGAEIFTPIIAPTTSVPARRTVHFAAPKDGGDVLVKIVEGNTHIKVTKPEPKAKNTSATVEDANSDESEDESDDEEEEKREKVWKVGSTLAEAAIRGVKKGGKVEVTIIVSADLTVKVECREVGGKGGVRGTI